MSALQGGESGQPCSLVCERNSLRQQQRCCLPLAPSRRTEVFFLSSAVAVLGATFFFPRAVSLLVHDSFFYSVGAEMGPHEGRGLALRGGLGRTSCEIRCTHAGTQDQQVSLFKMPLAQLILSVRSIKN